METIGIIYVVSGILYTIACCMDGPDLKPRWRRWLGMKLERYADNLKPIDYCIRDKCKYYGLATVNLPQYEKKYIEMIAEFAKINALNSRPTIVMQNFDAVPVESRVMLSEGDIYEARMYQDMMRQHGIPDWQIPPHKSVSFLVEDAKRRCIDGLLNEAKQFVDVKVDEESHWPGIIIMAKMLVGKKNNYGERQEL